MTDKGRELTRDHIVPRSKYHLVYGTKNGKNSLANLQVLCAHCNGRKSDTIPPEFPVLFNEETWGENNWII